MTKRRRDESPERQALREMIGGYLILHKYVSETLLELSADQKYLGAVPVLFRFYIHGDSLLVTVHTVA